MNIFSKKPFVITLLTLTMTLFGAAYAFAEDEPAPGTTETPETDTQDYTMVIGGEEIGTVDEQTDGEAALKELAKTLIPEGTVLSEVTVSESVDYVPFEVGPLYAGADDADSQEDLVAALKEKLESSKLTLNIKARNSKTATRAVRIKFKYTNKMYPWEFKLLKKGSKEKVKTIYEYTLVNGTLQGERQKVETKTVKKGKYRVILTGRKKTPENLTIKRFKRYRKKVDKVTFKSFGDVKLGKRLVNFGMKFLGNPYKVGGKSLTHGIDCVQFVRALYKHFGINLPENRHVLFKTGKVIPRSKARPGDVVFYGKHPAVYIGHGMTICASSKGGIRLRKLNFKRYTYIRRMR